MRRAAALSVQGRLATLLRAAPTAARDRFYESVLKLMKVGQLCATAAGSWRKALAAALPALALAAHLCCSNEAVLAARAMQVLLSDAATLLEAHKLCNAWLHDESLAHLMGAACPRAAPKPGLTMEPPKLVQACVRMAKVHSLRALCFVVTRIVSRSAGGTVSTALGGAAKYGSLTELGSLAVLTDAGILVALAAWLERQCGALRTAALRGLRAAQHRRVGEENHEAAHAVREAFATLALCVAASDAACSTCPELCCKAAFSKGNTLTKMQIFTYL